MFYVYILYSSLTGKYYTGHTENLKRRIEEHNARTNKSTAKGIPWEKIYSQEVNTRGEAMKLENRIKKRGARRFLEDLKGGEL